jgi:uncharacterized sodium:solute symporter family permease YidK
MAQTFVFALGVPATAIVLCSWWRGDPRDELVLPLAATGLVFAMAVLAAKGITRGVGWLKRRYDWRVRIAGVVLLVFAAVVVVPSLAYAGYLRLTFDADPAGIKRPLALVVAGLGACVGAIGAAAVLVGGREQ